MENIFNRLKVVKREERLPQMWSFRKIVAIEETLFNNTLERFYNLGISGLVRENIQNSLDGKLPESDKPVEVIIKTGTIAEDQIPGIEEIKDHIRSLRGENRYTKETIDHMKKCLDMDQIPYISFEDRNTKGLKGAMHGELVEEGDTWGIYAYKKGVHHTENDEEWENTRGGSHGVGKIASNAASDLHLMYFANCDKFGNQHIGGTVELIEHELNEKKYRATGYFAKDIEDKYFPYENNFDPVFEKNTRGLKIIVPYLREQFRSRENIIKAICDNFFIAILKERLEVKVDGIRINKDSIVHIVSDPQIYPEQLPENIKTDFTPLYVKTYLNKEPMEIIISDKNKKEYPFALYFTFGEKIKKGRVAIVRGIGMKIEDKKINSHANTSFNAVMIPKTSVCDVFLKSLENESHTSLSYEHIKDTELQNNAKRFINNLTKEMQKIIAEYIAKENPADGQIDTSELIYSVERNFKKNLSTQIETVELSKDRKNGKKKNVVKVRRPKRLQDPGKQKDKKPRTGKARVHKGTNRESYPVNTEAVKRVVLKDKEIIAFDFSGEKQFSGETNCDISIAAVDGMGYVEENTFNISENYIEVTDQKTGSKCDIEGNTIKNVSIDQGKVNLHMKTTEKFNHALKFLYFVEV